MSINIITTKSLIIENNLKKNKNWKILQKLDYNLKILIFEFVNSIIRTSYTIKTKSQILKYMCKKSILQLTTMNCSILAINCT